MMNLLIDGEWIDDDLVKIRADNVVLRHCTLQVPTQKTQFTMLHFDLKRVLLPVFCHALDR